MEPTVTPHPLAERLAAEDPPGLVLLLGIGSGRNCAPFQRRGKPYVAYEAAWRDASRPLPLISASCMAVLATHVFQHGDRASVNALLAEVGRVSHRSARLLATFGSIHDARFGRGARIADDCYVPAFGHEEAGIPHLYLDAADIEAMLYPLFTLDRAEEHSVDSLVGDWAHERPTGMRHWFVEARRR